MIWVISYVFFIVLADILAARWIVPLPFGLAVPAGVFAIAPIFTIRDQIHEKYGKRGAYIAVLVASLIAWGVAAIMGNGLLARITLASLFAFFTNELLDTEIYHRLRKRSKLQGIIGSNTVSSLVDSVVFIWIAFGFVWQLMLGQYIVKMIISIIMGIWITRKERKDQ